MAYDAINSNITWNHDSSLTGLTVDLIKKGKTGFIYKLNDLNNLKKYILRIYNSRKKYLRMSQYSKNIINKYHPKKSVKIISDVVMSL
jgi:hypothetical protein